ncbi:TadE/TadG family type IV pilus assembly protein [Hydrogenophaga palleronii]|uniref:TadE/TadG family type IV pilus assembly protein n=1 Tax=Hydrogenophaga palleronii TaxID=65655 RepID=UPI000826E35F|nr:TadE/TadG family type IV pilus assembly protein [Hydrogenophaga palleronii]
MMHTRAPQPRSQRLQRRQRGVYAIEYAMTFLLFFGIVYAIICYAILFTFRFGLQTAAEDGARAALRHQTSLVARQSKAREVAQDRSLGWKPADAVLTIPLPEICQTATGNCLQPAGTLPCSNSWAQRCQVNVTVRLSDLHRVLPPFPGFALPNELVGRASVMLDGGAL